MQQLLIKMTENVWSADQDIDWSRPIRLPRWIRRKTYIKLISQFYHAEVISQQVCRRLLSEVKDEDAKQFFELQYRDEAKHQGIYEKYITQIGELAPIEREMAEALERTLSWTGSPVALIAAFHVIFEGGALGILEKLTRNFPCPLFREINRKILPDEALHVAFGVEFVRREIAKLPASETRQMYDWMYRIWNDCAIAVKRRQTLPIRLATKLKFDWVNTSWERQRSLLQRMGFETGMPDSQIVR